MNRDLLRRLAELPVIGLFFEKQFLHYLWTGGLFTILNIVLVWLCIDVLGIPTIVSSTIVIGGLFILRYLVYRVLHIM